MFRNKASFYGEELSTPRPTPKLEDHPLSAVRYCLFSTFLYNTAQNTFHIHTCLKTCNFTPRRFERGNTWVRWDAARVSTG
jgi:hypothetical protein